MAVQDGHALNVERSTIRTVRMQVRVTQHVVLASRLGPTAFARLEIHRDILQRLVGSAARLENACSWTSSLTGEPVTSTEIIYLLASKLCSEFGAGVAWNSAPPQP